MVLAFLKKSNESLDPILRLCRIGWLAGSAGFRHSPLIFAPDSAGLRRIAPDFRAPEIDLWWLISRWRARRLSHQPILINHSS